MKRTGHHAARRISSSQHSSTDARFEGDEHAFEVWFCFEYRLALGAANVPERVLSRVEFSRAFPFQRNEKAAVKMDLETRRSGLAVNLGSRADPIFHTSRRFFQRGRRGAAMLAELLIGIIEVGLAPPGVRPAYAGGLRRLFALMRIIHIGEESIPSGVPVDPVSGGGQRSGSDLA